MSEQKYLLTNDEILDIYECGVTFGASGIPTGIAVDGEFLDEHKYKSDIRDFDKLVEVTKTVLEVIAEIGCYAQTDDKASAYQIGQMLKRLHANASYSLKDCGVKVE